MTTCSIEGCAKPLRYKLSGLCGMHYMRIKRQGHTDKMRVSGSFEEHYDEGMPGECWIWRGSLNAYGYGRYGDPVQMAHHVVYERHNGPIPTGLVLDHLCRTKACVNPFHLQPVRQGVNIERGLLGYALRQTCKNGLHDVSAPEAWYANKAGARTCLECKRANDRRAEAKRGRRTRSNASRP